MDLFVVGHAGCVVTGQLIGGLGQGWSRCVFMSARMVAFGQNRGLAADRKSAMSLAFAHHLSLASLKASVSPALAARRISTAVVMCSCSSAVSRVPASPDAHAGPEQHAEAADLATAVGRAMAAALTGYQRRIAVALLVDGVPVDVLADRLGTTRGALYKTLHVARTYLAACPACAEEAASLTVLVAGDDGIDPEPALRRMRSDASER